MTTAHESHAMRRAPASHAADGAPGAPRSARATLAAGSLRAIGQGARRVIAVADCELRLRQRGAALWVVLALIALPCALMGATATTVFFGGGPLALVIAAVDILFTVMLLPFLLLDTFRRDQARRVAPLIWSSLVSSSEYALGKGLAVVALGGALPLAGLAAGWIALFTTHPALASSAPWFAVAPLTVLTGALVAVLALLAESLTPWPILGALVIVGASYLAAFFSLQTLLRLTDLGALTVYYSPSIGFGPDMALLVARSWTYLAVGTFALALLMILRLVREPRGAVHRGHWAGALLAALFILALAVGAFGDFRAVAASYTGLGPAPAAPIAANVSGYTLDVAVDPGSGTVQGTAIFALVPTTAGGASTVELALNAGLSVRGVTDVESGVTVPYSPSRLGWTAIDARSTTFASGAPVTLRVAYAGRLALDRDDYAGNVVSLISSTQGGVGTEVRAYAGQGMVLLAGDGDWYPLPWTTSTPRLQQGRQSMDAVRVRVSAGYRVFCPFGGAAAASSDPWDVRAVPRAPLPMAFLAALATPNRTTLGGLPVYYRGARPTGAVAHMDVNMLDAAQRIDQWLGSGPGSWTGVVLPLISQPVVGSGLVLLPESPGFYAQAAAESSSAAYRAPAQAIAEAWWANAILIGATGTYQNTRPNQMVPNLLLQTPNGYLWLPEADPDLLDLLAGYTAGTVADEALGHGERVAEIAALTALYTAMRAREAHPNQGPDPALDSAYNAASRLGLVTNGYPYIALPLYHVEGSVGPARTTALLRTFANLHVTVPAHLDDFSGLAASALGFDFAAAVSPYVGK